jgi:outer membrane receptor protein involved in Fe transport
MRSMPGCLASIGACLLVAAPLAYGEELTDGAGKEGVFTLGEISVIGQAEQEAAPTEDVVTGGRMLRFDRKTVAEAANLVPGVTVSRTGARNEGTLFVRGFDIKHAPLFLEYATANVKVGYEPIRDLVVEVGIDNLFDKNYAIDEGFPEPGRTWFAQARYRL